MAPPFREEVGAGHAENLVSRKSTSGLTRVGELKKYTWQELAKHNTRDDAWLAVDGTIYNVTSWISSHPGGEEHILMAVGRDATDLFNSYHPFTDKPAAILRKFAVGELATHEFPPYKKDSGFYRTCRKRVKEYFVENKLNPKNPLPGLWRNALFVAVFIFCYLGVNNIHVPYLFPFETPLGMQWRVLLAMLMGIAQAMPLLHVMHDCSHAAYSSKPLWWKIVGRFMMDYLAGASMISWHHQHVVGHHVYTNVVEADPDLPATLTGDLRRLVERQVFSPLYAYQHLYLPPLYGLLGLKFRVQDFVDTWFGKTNGPQRVNPQSWQHWIELFVSKTSWAIWRVVIPLFLLEIPATEFWSLFILAELFTGWMLAFNFQVSHVSTACDFPLGDKKADSIDDEWAVSQVKSSVDYAHGSTFATFMSGALNYQTTHHLFPTVSQYHYPRIAPIVKEVCKQYGVQYNHIPTFALAFKAHLNLLRQMGREGKRATIHMG